MAFKKIEVAQGTFMAWGRIGQRATVKTVAFGPLDGSDFNGGACPQLVGPLVEDSETYRDKGATKVDLKAGEMVTINAGQANLKKKLLQADPKPGDIVRITYIGTYSTGRGDGKDFDVEVDEASSEAIDAD